MVSLMPGFQWRGFIHCRIAHKSLCVSPCSREIVSQCSRDNAPYTPNPAGHFEARQPAHDLVTFWKRVQTRPYFLSTVEHEKTSPFSPEEQTAIINGILFPVRTMKNCAYNVHSQVPRASIGVARMVLDSQSVATKGADLNST